MLRCCWHWLLPPPPPFTHVNRVVWNAFDHYFRFIIAIWFVFFAFERHMIGNLQQKIKSNKTIDRHNKLIKHWKLRLYPNVTEICDHYCYILNMLNAFDRFFCKHFVFHRLLIWLRDIYSPNLVNTLFFRIALNNFSVLFEKIKCDDKAVWESATRNFGHFFLSFKWIQWILARRSKSFITI